MVLQNSILKRIGVLFALSSACTWPSATQTVTEQSPGPSLPQLRAGFVRPPTAARLRCYWWWLNGHTDAATITSDLEQMKAKGFGGALLVDANGANQDGNADVPAGPLFGSKPWIALYLHALREADRLGLEITLNITSGWNLGGPGVTPQDASKVLTWSRTPVEGGHAVTLPLPMPAIRSGFYRQIAVLAYPLHHGRGLALQPGSPPASASADPAAAQAHSAAILTRRAAGTEAGFSMPDTSEMLNDTVISNNAVPGDPTGATGFADTGTADVQDLTNQVGADGLLHWQPPAGEWELLRIGYTDSGVRVSTASGAWQGLAIDYMSRAAFQNYWQQSVEPLLLAAKPFHSLKYLATDSWEMGGENWTDNFREEFLRRRGYDPVPWLPVVAGRIVGSGDQSTRFLTDLRRTVADLITVNHYGTFAEDARAYGLGVQAESGGPHGAPIDALETFRAAAIPQTEFWSQNAHRSTDEARFFVKEAASAAHIYGNKYGQTLVAAEGETSVGPQWSESLATNLKPSFDMAVTEGMNRLVWHQFTSSPASTGLPGQEYFAGTHLNPKVTWWTAGTPFFLYLNRMQYLMQQGLPVDDLLYFYGDNVPNFVRLKADDPAHVLPGYDYDVTDEDALLHTIAMDGGRLRGPGGMQWRALALPETRRLSLAVLERVELYIAEGGTVIGLKPQSTTGQQTPQTQAAFQVLADKVWGTHCQAGSKHAYARGMVYCTADAHAAFTAMGLPQDVSVIGEEQSVLDASSTSALDYIHQRIGGTDLYFLRNGSDKPSHHSIAFRIADELPQMWDPLTGEMQAAPGAHLLPGGRVEVPVMLAPFGSSILAFSAGIGRPVAPPLPTTATLPVAVTGPWSITFQADRGAPQAPVETTALKSWTTWSDPGIRYFSGTAVYQASVMAPTAAADKRVWLRFPSVLEIGQVTINGKYAGTLWAEPFMLRVDSFLHPGANRLTIAVTNLWPNRIIGDLQPSAIRRYTLTNIQAYTADSPLLPSGLIGQPEWVIER